MKKQITEQDINVLANIVAKRLPTTESGFVELFQIMNEYSEGSGPKAIQEDLAKSGHGNVIYGTRSDGMGNSDSVWVIPGDENGKGLRALWTFYDHETPLNFYGADEAEAYGLQERFYKGLPEDFLSLLSDRNLETYELLNIVDPVTGKKLYYASSALLLEDGVWKPLPGYVELAKEFNNDGGLDYIFDQDWYDEDDETLDI